MASSGCALRIQIEQFGGGVTYLLKGFFLGFFPIAAA